MKERETHLKQKGWFEEFNGLGETPPESKVQGIRSMS